jgi:hypothetical protein
MITTVTINDAPLDPCQVLAEVTVLHGRGGFGESSQPMSATIRVEQPAGAMPSWASGDVITLDGDTGRMFAGRIVDRSLTHFTESDGSSWGRFTVTAAGPLAVLGLRRIGDVPWPQETGTQRATRILTAAGTPWAVDGTVDLSVLARDVDAQPAAGLLDELASWTSAAVFDTPTGEVVYQALSGRNRPVVPFMWSDFAEAMMWSDFDPALTWNGDSPSIGEWPSPTSEFPIVLPCTAVVFEPEWSSSEATIINEVAIGYGLAEPQAEVRVEDADSITAHGRRYLYQGTQLATLADATTRASHIITTQWMERWQIGDVTVALDLLDPPTYEATLGLVCGAHVTLQGLPQPAPATDWTGIVEGWTFTQWADGGVLREQMVLTLSDPLMSLAVLRWDSYPGPYLWSEHPAYLTWDDLTTVGVLEAA